MASGQKKVVIRTFAAELAWGYLPQSGFAFQGAIALLPPDGRITTIKMNEIKTIAYVRDFNLDDPDEPERIGRRSFPARPRGDGLWLKLTFVDDDTLEGLANLDITFADSLIADGGLFLTPPDTRGNTQRVFVPRTALRSLEVLGYVTAPSKRVLKGPAASPASATQTSLFAEPDE
jgi:hypothetical protein